MTTVELACDRLTCLVGLYVERAVADVLDEARALAAQTVTAGDHVKLVFADPLDVVLGARHLDAALADVYVMSIVASRAATEMLLEPTPLARDTWAWLVAKAGPAASDRGVFAIRHHGGPQVVPIPDALSDGRLPDARGLVLAVIARNDCRIEHVTSAGTIGRTTASRIPIIEGTISRRHVGLDVDEHGAWTARDLGSSGGYYVAGRQAGGRIVQLHPGLVLQFAMPSAVAVLAIR